MKLPYKVWQLEILEKRSGGMKSLGWNGFSLFEVLPKFFIALVPLQITWNGSTGVASLAYVLYHLCTEFSPSEKPFSDILNAVHKIMCSSVLKAILRM